jgi:hypothetical protein
MLNEVFSNLDNIFTTAIKFLFIHHKDSEAQLKVIPIGKPYEVRNGKVDVWKYCCVFH